MSSCRPLQIILDRETQRSRGFGFVTFSSEQAMRDAIEGMNGKELDGRSITVNEAQSRGGPRSGGGGSYGRREGGGGYGSGGSFSLSLAAAAHHLRHCHCSTTPATMATTTMA